MKNNFNVIFCLDISAKTNVIIEKLIKNIN